MIIGSNMLVDTLMPSERKLHVLYVSLVAVLPPWKMDMPH